MSRWFSVLALFAVACSSAAPAPSPQVGDAPDAAPDLCAPVESPSGLCGASENEVGIGCASLPSGCHISRRLDAWTHCCPREVP